MPRPPALLVAAAAVAAAGCVRETPTGTGSAFTFETWIPASLTLAGVVVLAAGVGLLAKRRWKPGLVALAVGLFGLVLGPNLFFDRAEVDDEHLSLRTGFWFAPTVHEVRFADVASIEGEAQERSTRRGTRTDFTLVFRRRSGPAERVPLGDLMKRGPMQKALQVAAGRGIPMAGVVPDPDD